MSTNGRIFRPGGGIKPNLEFTIPQPSESKIKSTLKNKSKILQRAIKVYQPSRSSRAIIALSATIARLQKEQRIAIAALRKVKRIYHSYDEAHEIAAPALKRIKRSQQKGD